MKVCVHPGIPPPFFCFCRILWLIENACLTFTSVRVNMKNQREVLMTPLTVCSVAPVRTGSLEAFPPFLNAPYSPARPEFFAASKC